MSSSSDLSSISSQSDSSSSDNSSQQQSEREYIDKRKKKYNNKFKNANIKRMSNNRKSSSNLNDFQNTDHSSTTPIITSLRKKSIKFNLQNQETTQGGEDTFQQRVNRGRRKSKFSKTDFVQGDGGHIQSLQMKKRNTQQLIMKKKISDGDFSNYPQSILKKSSFERSKSVIENPANMVIENTFSPGMNQNQKTNLIPSLEYIVNESNPQFFQNLNSSPANQIQNRNNSQNSQPIFPLEIIQSLNEKQNDYDHVLSVYNYNESQNNLFKDNLRNKGQRLSLENNGHLMKIQIPQLNISDTSQQNNSNPSLNNFSNSNAHTPQSRNSHNLINNNQLNNSIQTPLSQISSKNQKDINGNYGFSDLVIQYASNSTMAYSNPSLQNTISGQSNTQHRSPSQQQILYKKKDYQEVLKELVDTQERLRIEEEKNDLLSQELKKNQEKNMSLSKQQDILLKKSSHRQSLLKEMKLKLNKIQSSNNLVPIHVPFNQRMMSKLNHIYTLIFYKTIFISEKALQRQPSFCENSFQYIKNSIYIYNLLVINSLLTIIVAPSIFMNKNNAKKIDSYFYSAFGSEIIPQMAIQIFTTIFVMAIAHLINLSHMKRQQIRAKSKNIQKMSYFKLVFNSFDFKENKSEEQVAFYKQTYSQILKQLIKNKVYLNTTERINIFLNVFKFLLCSSIVISAIFALNIVLSFQYSDNILYQGAVLSTFTIVIAELVSFFNCKITDLRYFKLNQTILKNNYKIQSVSVLILSCYFVASCLNLLFQKEQLIFLASIKTPFNFITDPSQGQLNQNLQIECPEKIVSYILLQFAVLVNLRALFKNLVTFLKNKLFYSLYQKYQYKRNQYFDFYENQFCDCLLFLMILINQSFFFWSSFFGLCVFLGKFLINCALLRSSKVLDFSYQQSFKIQNRFNSDFTCILIISILYQFIFNSLSYEKFFDQNGQLCGPFEESLNLSGYIYENLFTHCYTQYFYTILTWPPLLWILLLCYLMRQWINNYSGSEWQIENKNQGKMMKEVNKHYQQKLQNLEVRIKNTKIALISSQNQQINRIQQ